MNYIGAHDAQQADDVQMPRRRWWRRWRAIHLVALAGYLALSVGMFGSALFASRPAWSGGEADPELFMWFLRYVPWALVHGHTPFFTTWIVYPQGVNLLWNTSMIVPAVVFAPVTTLLGPVAAFNLLMVVSVATSAWAMYLVLGRFTPRTPACVLGGLAYGFSGYMVNQSYGHLNLTIAWYPPVLLLLLDMIVLRPDGVRRWRAAVVLGLATAVQLLTGEEMLASSAIAAAVLLLVMAALHPRRVRSSLRLALPPFLLGVAVFAVLAAYPLKVQFLGPQRVSALLQPRDRYATDPANVVVPTMLQHFGGSPARDLSSHFTGGLPEWDAYMGIPLLLVLVVILAAVRRKRVAQVAAISALLLGVLSLGEHLHVGGRTTHVPLPWHLFAGRPMLENIMPSRFMLYVFLGVGVVVALGVEAALRSPQPWLRVAGVGVVAAALVPLTPAIPYPTTPASVPAYFAAGGPASRLPDGTVVMIAPFSYPYRAALWQVTGGIRFRMIEGMAILPGGRFGAMPTPLQQEMASIDQGKPARTLDAARRSAIRGVLRDDGVEEVVVGPYDFAITVPNPEEIAAAGSTNLSSPVVKVGRAVAVLTEVLGRPPKLVDGVYLWSDVRSDVAERAVGP